MGENSSFVCYNFSHHSILFQLGQRLHYCVILHIVASLFWLVTPGIPFFPWFSFQPVSFTLFQINNCFLSFLYVQVFLLLLCVLHHSTDVMSSTMLLASLVLLIFILFFSNCFWYCILIFILGILLAIWPRYFIHTR